MGRAMVFADRLSMGFEEGRYVSVELAPDPKHLPQAPGCSPDWDGADWFCRAVIGASADHAAAFQFSWAHFVGGGLAGMHSLLGLCKAVHEQAPRALVIIDGNFGASDEGANTQMARFLFRECHADAVTLSPYVGGTPLEPFWNDPHRGAFVFARGSRDGCSDLQDQLLCLDDDDSEVLRVYQDVIARTVGNWDSNHNLAVAMGADVDTICRLRTALPPPFPCLIRGWDGERAALEALVTALGPGAPFLLTISPEVLLSRSGPGQSQFVQAATVCAEQTNARVGRLLR